MVADPVWEKGRKVFENVPAGIGIVRCPQDEESLARAIRANNSRAAIVGTPKYVGALYEVLSGTGIIARFGVGYDGIALSRAREERITVTNTPGVLDTSVAELVIWFIGCLARRIVELDARVKEGEFRPVAGMELSGKSLCLVGFGRIAKKVARMAGLGLGMQVHALGRKTSQELEQAHGAAIDSLCRQWGICSYTSDASVLGSCDYVSCHVPATEMTRRFFNAEAFSAMKDGSFFINTSRGTVVDEGALYDALKGGKLRGAALDVFENEPYVPVDPQRDLRTCDNLIITPHIGSNTDAANEAMARESLRNVLDFLAGRFTALNAVVPPPGAGDRA